MPSGITKELAWLHWEPIVCPGPDSLTDANVQISTYDQEIFQLNKRVQIDEITFGFRVFSGCYDQ